MDLIVTSLCIILILVTNGTFKLTIHYAPN